MPPAPPAFRSGSSFIRGGHVSQSTARKQVALARSVDLRSLELGLVWTFLAFSLSLSFVAALADVTMGTVTSAAAYMANVKNRIADFLMCLSLPRWSRLMFKVASTEQMLLWKSNQFADFGADHRPGPPKKRAGLGRKHSTLHQIRDSAFACYGTVAENAHRPITLKRPVRGRSGATEPMR
jgi:hypothetical protein